MAHPGSSRLPSVSRRLRIPSRAAWLGARAANVWRRPLRLALTWGISFPVLLGAYLVAPVGVTRARTFLPQPPAQRADTGALATALARAQERLAATDSNLAVARRQLAALRPDPRTEGGAGSTSDSLQAVGAALAGLVQRARTVPLPESYRALGAHPVVRSDPRVPPLLDSLERVVRARQSLGGVAGTDPQAIALATAANAVGRDLVIVALEAIERVVREIQAEARGAVATTDSMPLSPDSLVDTVALLDARRRASGAALVAQRALDLGRRTNAQRDSLAAAAATPTQLAPVAVLVAGAAVLAAFVAVLTGLIDEMRSPRVADPAEAERLAGLRVLTVARWRPVPPERSRRAADRALPPWLDPTSDDYRILAAHLTARWPRDGIVTVAADDPIVAAVVAGNLAAVLAVDARSTVLIDTVFEQEPVRTLLALPQSPGLAGVLENKRRWSESLVPVAVGRSRSLLVFPSGHRSQPPGPAESQAAVDELVRAARRHDATVVVATTTRALTLRAGDDVIVCAVRGATRLATFGRSVASLIDAGARVRGVVLWDGRVPTPSPAA